METLKEYHYTYYSYEEWGIGYFGSRTCRCLPEKDVKYFGSFKDKNFNPTQKIILKSDYATRDEAYADEIILHDYYEVDINPHFANKSKLTTTKFSVPKEQRTINGKKGAEILKNNNAGVFTLTHKELSNAGKSGGTKSYELGVGIHAQTKEERQKNGKLGCKKSHEKQKELGVGFWGLTLEQRQENVKKGDIKRKENKSGLYGLSTKERSEAGKKSAQQLHSQRWMCIETGHITNAGALTRYQKHRGIDTSKRVRIS